MGVLQKTNIIYQFKCFFEIVSLKTTIYIHRFDLNYPIEKTYNPPF